ncbi:hypothetical protein MHB48_15170 [Psychrobacillus sp. FSL H8-0483]|uniref:hypothetical protein n=1 Tax=Psychrobacillus sp. FSL H8-0483 TaxID=2921389 RepID=UPI003159AC26
MEKLEEYILDDIRKWKEEISAEIKRIDMEIEEKKKKIEINEIKMNIVEHSADKLGYAKVVRDTHWETYGKPLLEENENLSNEINLSVNTDLFYQKRSLTSLDASLTEFFKRNE